jgi:hypothetical protein
MKSLKGSVKKHGSGYFLQASTLFGPGEESGCWGCYLGGVRPEAGLCGESLPADGAVERPVLGSLHLGVMVPQVLLKV